MNVNQWIVMLSIVLSAIAAVANAIGARNARGSIRSICVARATLAAGYSLSYTWLFFHEGSRLHWSYVMSGAALVVWPVVWTIPAILITGTQRQLAANNEALHRQVEELLKS